MHDCVKFAVAARIKSFITPDIAPLAALVEQPVKAHYGLRDPLAPNRPETVLSLHAEVQQQPVICDFFPCHSRGQQYGWFFIDSHRSGAHQTC
jgi:hypothetical protein